jgi:hypothetical protein
VQQADDAHRGRKFNGVPCDVSTTLPPPLE